MRKFTPLKLFAGLILFLMCRAPVQVLGQSNRIENFIRAGKADARALTKAYLKPVADGIGANLNTGWFNTAKTHKLLGFDLQIRGALASVPSSDREFNVNNLNLENTKLAAGEPVSSPTSAGTDSRGPGVIVRDSGQEVARFNLPRGSGFHFTPSPMIQASVGLIKHTDVIVRFVPKIHIGNYGDFQMEGAGIKHSISQWLPGGKHFPINIALMAAYNRINLNAALNLKPSPTAAADPDFNGNYDNQKVKDTFNTFMARIIVSKDLPFISVYAAGGYQTSTAHLDATGNYPVIKNVNGIRQTVTVTDPFSYEQDGANKFSFTGGLKLKLFFFNIFGQFTLADYSVINGGIGFSFR